MTVFLEPWFLWFMSALVLLFGELFVTRFILCFFACGCIAVSWGLVLFEIAPCLQWLLFVVVSAAGLVFARKFVCKLMSGP